MASFSVRLFNGSEYESIGKVFKGTMAGFLGTAESLRESDLRPLVSGPRGRFVAESDGKIVGLAQFQPNVHAKKLGLTVLVLDEFWKQGIGTALYDVALASVLSHDPDLVCTEASELSPESLAFAERRGFREHTCVFESRFDLAQTSEEALTRLLPKTFSKGEL